MLSNYHNFDEIITLQETLIDLMFDYIEDKNILLDNILDKDLVEFKNKIGETFNINIIYKKGQNLSAQFEKPNIIVIYLPRNYNNITGNQLLRVFLHELSHYFTSQRVPDYLIKHKKINNQTITQRLDNRLKHPPSQNVPWDAKDVNLVNSYLNYVYQSKELPNFALTFALAFLENEEEIDNFFKDNHTMIKKRIEDKITINQLVEFYALIPDNDLRLLFQIHYFTYYVKNPSFQRKLIELKKLIRKYYRRLLVHFR